MIFFLLALALSPTGALAPLDQLPFQPARAVVVSGSTGIVCTVPTEITEAIPTMDTEQTDFVRVTNTRPAFLHLPDVVEEKGIKGEDGVLKEIRHNVIAAKSLIPGGNNIDRAEWERVKKNKTVRDWLAIGWLKEGGDVNTPEGPEPPKDLTSYGQAAALLLIDGEDRPDTLRQWATRETRPEVSAAIKRRIEAVGVGLPKLPPLNPSART